MTKTGAYSCLDAVKDDGGKGHLVIIRQGRSDPSGFGFIHMFLDHNLDVAPVEVTIFNNAAGEKYGVGRYLYGEYHKAPKGQVDQYVEIRESREPSHAAKDSRELGIVTAYCRNKSYILENRCPNWVNESL